VTNDTQTSNESENIFLSKLWDLEPSLARRSRMNCMKCGSDLIAEVIEHDRYDCCVIQCSGCHTIVDKTWKKKSQEEVDGN
jgi:hypothetical protein